MISSQKRCVIADELDDRHPQGLSHGMEDAPSDHASPGSDEFSSGACFVPALETQPNREVFGGWSQECV
jgi:hypothetical protein